MNHTLISTTVIQTFDYFVPFTQGERAGIFNSIGSCDRSSWCDWIRCGVL